MSRFYDLRNAVRDEKTQKLVRYRETLNRLNGRILLLIQQLNLVDPDPDGSTAREASSLSTVLLLVTREKDAGNLTEETALFVIDQIMRIQFEALTERAHKLAAVGIALPKPAPVASFCPTTQCPDGALCDHERQWGHPCDRDAEGKHECKRFARVTVAPSVFTDHPETCFCGYCRDSEGKQHPVMSTVITLKQ